MSTILVPRGWRGRDPYGDGRFLASRVHTVNGESVHEYHWGADALGLAGESWPAPCAGVLERRRPYASDLKWDGFMIRTEAGMLVTVFYVEVPTGLCGHEVTQGQLVGKLQDLRLKYPARGASAAITLHAHVEVRWPTSRVTLPAEWVGGVDYLRRLTGRFPGVYVDPARLAGDKGA